MRDTLAARGLGLARFGAEAAGESFHPTERANHYVQVVLNSKTGVRSPTDLRWSPTGNELAVASAAPRRGDVTTLDYSHGRIVTGWRRGDIRLGATESDAAEHRTTHVCKATVSRLRVAGERIVAA